MLSHKVDLNKTGIYVLKADGFAHCHCCNKSNYVYHPHASIAGGRDTRGRSEPNRVKMYKLIIVDAREHSIGRRVMFFCATCMRVLHNVTRPPKRSRKPKTLTWQEEVEQGIREAEKGMSDANLAMNDVFCVLDDSEVQRRLTKEQRNRVLFLRSEAEQFIDDTDYQLEVQ